MRFLLLPLSLHPPSCPVDRYRVSARPGARVSFIGGGALAERRSIII
jgi:hypothetical protein